MPAASIRPYTPREEIAHGITHGVGALLSIAGLVVLVTFAAMRGSAWQVVGCSVYGGTLILLYTASTLYHSIHSPKANKVLRVLDHASIYLLIAGTCTPFALKMRGPVGWGMFATIWSLAFIGIAFKVFSSKRFREVTVISYLAMGWLAAAAVPALSVHLEPGGLTFLALGGGAYTGGVGFYAWQSLPYNHFIWHLFVLAGSVLHYMGVLLYVVLT